MSPRLLEDLLMKKKAVSVIVPMKGWELVITPKNLEEGLKILAYEKEAVHDKHSVV